MILSFFITGCTSTIVKSKAETEDEYYSRITKLCNGREIVVKTNMSDEYAANEIIIKRDSTILKLSQSNILKTLSTEKIKYINYSDFTHGITLGTGGGAVISLASLLIIPITKLGNMNWPIYFLSGAVISTIVGGILGAYFCNQVEIIINN